MTWALLSGNSVVPSIQITYYPCHVVRGYISFWKDPPTVSGLLAFQTPKELREWINTKMPQPLLFMCITQKEVDQWDLAKRILAMKKVAYYSGPSPLHNGEIFHDIWFGKTQEVTSD